MPIPFSYPETSWSQHRMRTRGDVELAANIQRLNQSQVRGWSEDDAGEMGRDGRNNHEQRSGPNKPT